MSATSSSHTWKIAASVVLAGVLFGYFLWRAPLAEVGRAFTRVQPWWAVAAVLAAISTYVLRALRWGIILRPVGKAPAGKLIGATAAGFATSTLLPARAGEVVRPLLLSAQTGFPAAATLASILTERLFDGATILVLFAIGVLGTKSTLGSATGTAPAKRSRAFSETPSGLSAAARPRAQGPKLPARGNGHQQVKDLVFKRHVFALVKNAFALHLPVEEELGPARGQQPEFHDKTLNLLDRYVQRQQAEQDQQR